MAQQSKVWVFAEVEEGKVAQVSLELVTKARDMLWANRSRWNRTTTGNTRTGLELWVYGRGGRPCRRCGEPIRKADDGPRITYWCPACQT